MYILINLKRPFVLSILPYAYVKDGILDVERMRPKIPHRSEEQFSHQAEIALHSARSAIAAAGKTVDDIGMIIISCAYTKRSYPAIAA